jgi:glycosyltransferase involved in cell wall biosynthesis
MALIEFTEVSIAEADNAHLWGSNLEFPRTGSQTEGNSVEIIGWVLGRTVPAVAVEATEDGHLLRRTAVDIQRHDVAAFYPEAQNGDRSGFRMEVPMTGLGKLQLTLTGVLKNQTRVSIGVIHARRRWREDRKPADTPLISVIIPSYNQGHFLHEAIESVIAQTYPHVEVVVIDDGSMDNVEEIAQRYPGVRCVRQENQGLAAARNTGLRRSRGEYLVFLDADDRLMPKALETGLTAFAAHPESAFVTGHCRPMTVDGTPFPPSEEACADGDYYLALLSKCFIYPPATVMYRRSVFETVHVFNTDVSPCADYDLYLKIAREFPIHCHHQLVAEYRKHGTNMTGDPALMLRAGFSVLQSQWKFIKRNSLWRKSYRKGIKFMQQCYGPPLAKLISQQLKTGEWSQACSNMATLLRYCPRDLLGAFRG